MATPELDILVDALLERAPERSDDVLEAVAMLTAQGTAEQDLAVLGNAVEQLERVGDLWRGRSTSADGAERVGRLSGIVETARWALDHARLTAPPTFARGSRPHDFLTAVERQPRCSNEDIVTSLRLDAGQVSRLGTQLVADGLARKRRVGKENVWEVTPRGNEALRTLATAWSDLEHNKLVMRRFVADVLTGRDLDAIDDIVGQDFVDRSPDPDQEEGRAALKRHLRRRRKDFPHLRTVEEDLIAEGDKVAYRGRLKGLTGTAQDLAKGAPELRMARLSEGKIVEAWNLLDPLSLEGTLDAVKRMHGLPSYPARSVAQVRHHAGQAPRAEPWSHGVGHVVALKSAPTK